MWFFNSPRIVYGEDALSWLVQLQGKRAFIVTDAVMAEIGHLERTVAQLTLAGMECRHFTGILPDPDLETIKRCAKEMAAFAPDWVVGLGGGSAMDAAKAAWFSYERPDVDLEAVNPMENFGLRAKARLITIPTTAGSGAEVTAAAVLTDPISKRKFEMASYEVVPDLAIVDPILSASMPTALVADSGIDVLTHAIEGYSSTFANEFSDALCTQAVRMVFDNLPQAVADGHSTRKAREKMAIAAAISGLGMGNSHIALAHSLGHAAGAVFKLPHGRITGLFLPYAIEFTSLGGAGRYLGLTRVLDLHAAGESEAGFKLAAAVRELMRTVQLPLSLAEAGIDLHSFTQALGELCDLAELDSALATSSRYPYREDLERLFSCAYHGRPVDF